MTERIDTTPAPQPALQRLGPSAVERWRSSCPVRPEHKSVFPADPWRWQHGATAWVWGVLMAAGGQISAAELTERLAELRRLSRRQANGLRNQGLFVLEAFALIEIERVPAERGGRPTSNYGSVRVIRDTVDEQDARAKQEQAGTGRWNAILYRVMYPNEPE